MGMRPPPAGRAVCIGQPAQTDEFDRQDQRVLRGTARSILRRVGSHVPVFGPRYRHDRTVTSVPAATPFDPSQPTPRGYDARRDIRFSRLVLNARQIGTLR